VKTPCLKCGLIHDDPTAICDGYVGIDPDETAGDTRKQAAERIRAVLAAVPIESRRTGRARAAAAGAGMGTSASESTAAMRAAMSGAARTDAPEAEVPEWRREVTERLETYRNRRARQSRQGGTAGQSVLGFRVLSKTDTVEAPEELHAEAAATEALPAADAVAEIEAPAAAAESPDVSAAPAPMAAAIAAPSAAPGGPPAAAGAIVSDHAAVPAAAQRVYAPEETDLTESLSEHAFAAAVEAPADEIPARTEADRSAEKTPDDEETLISSTALPMAAEPAVVLADSATLEVQADPAELPLNLEDEETARLSPAASAQIAALATPAPAASAPAAAAPEMEAPPPAAIPAIDKDYWRAAPEATEAMPEAAISEPAPRSAVIPEVGESECGSLTSGFESHSGVVQEVEEEEEPAPAETEESAAIPVAPGTPADETPAPPAAVEEPAPAALAAAEYTSETLPPGQLDAPNTEEFDERRAALRTASRPFPGAATERIEISVPQPVFDFTVTHPQNLQPQDEGLPVADLRERRCAAALDGTILAFTIAGFFLAFHVAGGEISYSRVGAAVALTSAFLIYAQYILLFTLVGGATPGMVLRGLRVVSFDGRSPGSVELTWRAFGYLLSAAAAMLGFLWSAWDEHGLSWHDRISQTYITYSERGGSPAILTV